MQIAMIAAMAENRVIGKDNTMPWHLPADLKHFKQVTMGKPVIMGRKTYESIGRALPGRTNIVVSRQAGYDLDDAVVVDSTDAAMTYIRTALSETDEVMVIGGGTIYEAFLPEAQRLYLTFIDAEIEGDTYFPDYQSIAQWQQVDSNTLEPDDNNRYRCQFVTLERVAA